MTQTTSWYRTLTTIGIAAGVLLAVSPGWTADQTLTASGEVDSAVSNPLNILMGTPLSIVAMYDDSSLMNSGLEAINLGQGPGFSFALDIGGGLLALDQTSDISFPNAPTVRFDNGTFDGFDFVSNDFSLDGSQAFVSVFDGLEVLDSDTQEPLIQGSFSRIDIQPSVSDNMPQMSM